MAEGLLGGLAEGARRLFGGRDEHSSGPDGRDEFPAAGGGGDLALVYRGPAASPGCPEAVARVLRECGLDVHYTGPRERTQLGPEALAAARVYAHPGGGDLDETWPHMKPHAHTVREFVRGGGVYLGFCLGAYLAGQGPGFRLLPGDTDQYCTSPHSEIDGEGNHVVTVDWRGESRHLFFQDGPWFDVPEHTPGLEVLARYRNGLPAAVVLPAGNGVLGLVGPHPEATRDWFTDVGLRTPPSGADLAGDLVRTALARADRSSAT